MIFFKRNSKNYCFIHVPKTAGTSLQNTIIKEKLEDKEYNLIFKNYMDKHQCKFDHTPFYFINSFFSKKFNLQESIHYVSIVRNPWHRMASLFEQELLRDVVGFSKKTALNNDIRNYLNKSYETNTQVLLKYLGFFDHNKRKDLFKFWLFYLGLNRKILPFFNPNLNVLPQSWWLVDELDNKIIENIFMFENLKSLEVNYKIKISHENEKKIKFNYSDYYDQQTIDYVSILDKYVIEKFGYDF